MSVVSPQKRKKKNPISTVSFGDWGVGGGDKQLMSKLGGKVK